MTDRRTIRATYTLTLHGPEQSSWSPRGALPSALLLEAEENLNELTPDGWWVEINEWDAAPRGSIVNRDPGDESGYYVPNEREIR